jgi:hypothetical protein
VKWRFHVPAVGSTGFLLHVPFSKTTEVSSCREERGRLIIIKLMTITHHHLQLIVFYLFVLKYSASYYYVIFLSLLIKIWGRLFKGGLVCVFLHVCLFQNFRDENSYQSRQDLWRNISKFIEKTVRKFSFNFRLT